MTITERQDLDRAIMLIGDLRTEMSLGFAGVNNSLSDVRAAQVAHEAVHSEREKQQESRGVSRRWVVQVVAATVISTAGVVIAALKLLIP